MSPDLNAISSLLDGITTKGEIFHAISDRQRMNANNVANAQTPGYTSKQASFADLLANAASPFETALSARMGGNQSMDAITGTGQPVNLQRELIQMQQNSLFYSVETRLISAVFAGLKQAAQVGR